MPLAVNAYEEMEVEFRVFLAWTLGGSKWPTSRPGRFTLVREGAPKWQDGNLKKN
jgi:hypothetical protein